MVNINLATSSSEASKTEFPYKKGLILMIILFLLVIGAYGGIILYTNKIVSDDERIKGQYDIEYAQLMAGNAKDVYDFQSRMNLAGKIVTNENMVIPSLQEMEKIMVTGAYLDSYLYDNKSGTIKLGCIGDNFGVIAKQILNFKNSQFFSSVNTGETSLDDKGKVQAVFELKIK